MNIAYLTKELAEVSATPRLDAELLLMLALKIDRAKLLMQKEFELTKAQQNELDQLVQRRLAGEPLAYILGVKEFWSLDLIVTPDVLIPRPDTECLIDYILVNHLTESKLKVADIGTGSGAIAIALAHEKPCWVLHATDISEKALLIAKQNAEKYQLTNINFFHGDSCTALPDHDYDIVVSNPPYIEANDPHLNDLQFEPQAALVSGEDGLGVIRKIAHQAKYFLQKNGLILLEHGYNQASSVAEILQQAGFHAVESYRDLSGNLRFTKGAS